MQLFRYKAVDAAGRIRRGRLSARDQEALDQHLQGMGLTVIAATPVSRTLRRRTATRRELIQFCVQLEQLVSAGVPLLQALVDLRDTLEEDRFREVVSGVIDHISEGGSFSGALAGSPDTFDSLFVTLVRAGEQSGQLPAVLRDLTESLKWQDEMSARAKKLLTYPALTGLVIGGVVLFLLIYLVPRLARFITSMEGPLPLHTELLLATSRFLMEWWWLLPALPMVVGVAGHLALRRSTRLAFRADELRLRIWLVGDILRKLALARFTRLFSTMYRAGIPILEILQVATDAIGNRALRQAVEAARGQVAEGQSLTAAFERAGLFPPLVLRMIATGETTGALDVALANVGYFYDRDVRERVERLEAMVGPILTLVLGLLLGWIMLAVLGPIYDLIGRLRV